jgi:hypothetical protein
VNSKISTDPTYPYISNGYTIWCYQAMPYHARHEPALMMQRAKCRKLPVPWQHESFWDPLAKKQKWEKDGKSVIHELSFLGLGGQKIMTLTYHYSSSARFRSIFRCFPMFFCQTQPGNRTCGARSGGKRLAGSRTRCRLSDLYQLGILYQSK